MIIIINRISDIRFGDEAVNLEVHDLYNSSEIRA